MEEKRIVVGMSGGVDSSVAAALLQRDGWDVVGVTCDFVLQDSSCCDARDAHAVCEVLGIRHVHRDASPRFAERIIAPFCEAYASGLTPSPCPSCNACMKIPELLEVADEVGAGYVATGHYARVARTGEGRFAVQAAADTRKDQSYMLARLSQEQLARLVLPLGEMTKPQVRALANEWGLPVALRPDSEDLCFAPDGYRALLAEHGIPAVPGPIRNTAGRVLGTHTGLADYTIGQRSGLGIGGAPEPYYVIRKDAAENALVVGFAREAKLRAVEVTDLVWQAFAAPPENLRCTVKLRYRSSAAGCEVAALRAGAGSFGSGAFGTSAQDDAEGSGAAAPCKTADVTPIEQGSGSRPSTLRVTLDEAQPLTAPGQFAVFYAGDTVLGSGMISHVVLT